MTIHYTTGDNGFEIVAFYPSCLEKYLKKTKGYIYREEDDIERKNANEIIAYLPVAF